MAITSRGAGAAPTPEGVLAGPVVIVLDPGVPGRPPIEFNTTTVDGEGVEWWADTPKGWEFPDVDTAVLPRAGRHGSWIAPGWYRARTLTLAGVFVAPTLAAAQRARSRLLATLDLTRNPGLMTVWEADPTQIEVRLAGRVSVDMSVAEGRHVAWQAPLVAADPRRYGTVEQSVTFGTSTAPTAGDGFELPLEFPFDFHSEGTITGGVAVDVAGAIETPPRFTFRGPCTAPSITNATYGETWAWTGSLLAGERLEVDVDAGTVLLNGVANRYYLTDPASIWWSLRPGRNVLSYAAGGAGSGDVTVQWRPAWL